MIEAIVILLIMVYTFRKTFLSDRGSRESTQKPASRPSVAPSPNRALTAMKNRANDLLRQTMQAQEQAAGVPVLSPKPPTGGQAASASQTKIAKRRRQQQATADRSRIHQSLHRKEAQADAKKAYEAMAGEAARSAAEHVVAGVPDYTEIRFGEHELMDEVYDIMACGYPSRRSGQRDFLAEGIALLERYTL